MRKLATLVTAACALALSALPALAETDPINTVVKGCDKELATYCKDVTPGGGRGLACLYAFSDKLSGRCEYALYDASIQLERFVAALTYMATECKDDLRQYCASVPAGEGRLIDCLDKNKEKVSDRCKQAFRDVGSKK
ncbi:MAG: hypothetical protein HGA98_03300 [Deltaproteobacteria bacterium]|nr:hypothetical protein [Deltaproteobacteria bacterium]